MKRRYRESAVVEVEKSRRTAVEVCDDLHREIRKLALLNDLLIHELTNAILEEYLKDQEKIKATIKKLRTKVN